jgi:hypothetical protein
MTELSRETEALLARGRAGTPLTPEHQARLKGAILARAMGVAVVTTTTSAVARTSLGAKTIGAVVLVAAVGGAGAAMGARMSNWTQPTPAVLAVNRGEAAPAMPPSRASSAQSPTAIASATSLRMASDTPSVTTPAIATPVSTAIAKPAPTTTPASPGRAPLPSSAGTTRSVAVPASTALPTSAVSPTLERQVRLLRDADLATKDGDPERALALLDEHAAAFPQSDLEPERSAERVFALCGAGRIEEARNAASTFLIAHPTGPLAARVKGACRAGPRE